MSASQQAVAKTLVEQHDQQVALAAATALARTLDAPRKILEAKTVSQTVFRKCGPIVLKCEVSLITHDLVYNPARNQLIDYRPPEPSFNASVCTEADLLDVQRDLEKYGSGKDRVDFREWLSAVRGESPAPLQITITNADQIGKIGKALKVSRDSDGKLTGAVIAPIE